MAKWEDNMRAATTPEGIMTTTDGEVGEGGNWSDNWRNAWTPEGLKIVGGGGGGGSNDVASSLEDQSTRVWVPDEMNVNSGVIMIGRPEGSEQGSSGVYTVHDMELYSNVGVDGEGDWSPSIVLYGASGTSGNYVNEIRLYTGNSGKVELEARAGLLLILSKDAYFYLSAAEGASGQFHLSFPGVENGQIVVSADDPPATPSSPGVPGLQAYDSNYLYVCIAADTWKRTPLSSW